MSLFRFERVCPSEPAWQCRPLSGADVRRRLDSAVSTVRRERALRRSLDGRRVPQPQCPRLQREPCARRPHGLRLAMSAGDAQQWPANGQAVKHTQGTRCSSTKRSRGVGRAGSAARGSPGIACRCGRTAGARRKRRPRSALCQARPGSMLAGNASAGRLAMWCEQARGACHRRTDEGRGP